MATSARRAASLAGLCSTRTMYQTSCFVQRRYLAVTAGHASLEVDYCKETINPGSCKEENASVDKGEVTDQVFDQNYLSTGSHSVSKEMYTVNIDKLCRAGNLSEAVRLLQSLRDRNISLPNGYDILLAAASERKDIGIASEIFKDSLLSGKSLSSTCYLNLARAFIVIDDCGYLLKFLKEVSEIAFPSSTTVTNRIIHAFSETRQIEKALLIYNEMKNLKCEPDLITNNTVLDMLGRVGRMDEMLQQFASIKESGFVPDIISYNTLLNSLKKLGRLDLCLVFYREMCNNGIEPDLLTYTALIEIFGRLGNVEESLRLFNELKARQISPSIYLYRSLINNLKKVGKMELVMKLLDEMNSSPAARVRNFDCKSNMVNR